VHSLASTLRGIRKPRECRCDKLFELILTGLRPFGKLRMSITAHNYIFRISGVFEELYLAVILRIIYISRETSLLVFFDHEKRERKSVLRPRVCATARTPKTPVFGLPKSRPSPLQKTPFFALSEAKSVQFRPICARKCTFLTPFLRT
jgi:hypothetical protein